MKKIEYFKWYKAKKSDYDHSSGDFIDPKAASVIGFFVGATVGAFGFGIGAIPGAILGGFIGFFAGGFPLGIPYLSSIIYDIFVGLYNTIVKIKEITINAGRGLANLGIALCNVGIFMFNKIQEDKKIPVYKESEQIKKTPSVVNLNSTNGEDDNKPEYTQELFNAAKMKWIYQYYSEKLSFEDTRILMDAMSDPESEDSKKIMRQYDVPQPNIGNFVQSIIDTYRLSTVPVKEILNDLNSSVPYVMEHRQLLAPLMKTKSIEGTKNSLKDLIGKHFNKNDFDKTTAYLNDSRIINASTPENRKGAILSSQQAMDALHDSICHRGFGVLPLAARATLGVLAYLFIIPAITVKCYAKASVKETFFGNPKPETARHVHDIKTNFEKTFKVVDV